MISIHYFASVRERLSREREELDLPEKVDSIDGLIRFLSERDPAFAAMADNSLLVAVNQTVVDREHRVRAGDEVAFFPPMTGG